jgi:hypothetical protein
MGQTVQVDTSLGRSSRRRKEIKADHKNALYDGVEEPRQLSRYNDRLRAGRLRGESSSPSWVKNFLFSTSSTLALGLTQPPIQWAPGNLFPRVKRAKHEADNSSPTSGEVKNMWIYISTPPYVFMA